MLLKPFSKAKPELDNFLGNSTKIGVIDQECSIISRSGPLLHRAYTKLSEASPAKTRTLLAKFSLSAKHVLWVL